MSRKTLNAANLEALGAEQLAALLLEVSTGSADIKRRLRLELSHHLGASELAHDVRKRLTSLRRSTSFIGWRKRKALIKDLNIQASMILDKIAPEDPTIAFDLLWDFIDIAAPLLGRTDDSKGEIRDVFLNAATHFKTISPLIDVDVDALGDRVWAALQANAYGEWDGLISLVAPALGEDGLATVKAHVETYKETPLDDGSKDHEALQFLRQLRGGTSYAAEQKARFVKDLLKEIATLEGDTSSYLAQFSDAELAQPAVCAQIAQRFLEDQQPSQALDILQRTDQSAYPEGHADWDMAYVAVLTALERVDEAQAHRWHCFETSLAPQHLREYLKRLPDFEDVEAQDRARAHVLDYPSAMDALTFCIQWPDLVSAAQLIDTRYAEIRGNQSARLSPAIEALRLRHPHAAVRLLRQMIDHTLDHGVSSLYDIAAEHLADCARLDGDISDYGMMQSHTEFLHSLQTHHARKTSFWAKFD